MTIDRAAWPFALAGALPSVLAFVAGQAPIGAALLVVPVAIALFFRDPERSPPAGRGLVLAPADGTVMHAGPSRPDEAPPGRWLQVTIFLSVLDVHINRTPVAGRVTGVRHVPGSFLPAFRPDSHRNEHSEIWLDHDGVQVVTRQVVGVLARRVVCRVRTGDELGPGERIGLMKFGSRMDVFLPEASRLLVARGDHVRAGETVIAELSRGDDRT
jgi:phosphatidylserine decarboxylase